MDALVEHLFRRQYGTITAALARALGAVELDLIDEAVQEALIRALRTWSIRGIPDNPEGWLVHVARNRARDELRRRARTAPVDPEGDAPTTPAPVDDPLRTADDAPDPDDTPVLADDQLRLVFTCCHPALSPDSRVALTLKCVSGFGVDEIARALRADARAVAQRLVRAKRTLRDVRAEFAAPAAHELPERLDDVLAVVYAVFNEGHTATAGDALFRRELCTEALRLQTLLVSWPPTAVPESHALHALMLFTAARLPARLDGDRVVTLEEQDRSRWDRRLIARGFHHLALAGSGDRLTRFHLEAEIAALHAQAPDYVSTDWARVVDAYDRLLQLAPSPMIHLARAIAMAERGDVKAAYAAVVSLTRDAGLASMPEVHAARGELARRLGKSDEAARAYRAALDRPSSEPVRHHLVDQLARLDS